MSWITDVIICVGLVEQYDKSFNLLEKIEPIEEVRAWLEEKDFGGLAELSSYMGTDGKAPSSLVYGGSYNHLDVEAFKEFVFNREWNDPDSVQVLLKDQEGRGYTMHSNQVELDG